MICPFTIARDNMEKAPWTFDDINAGSKHGNKPYMIQIDSSSHLKFGDYSIVGYERWIAIERKSKADLYGTIMEHLCHRNTQKQELRKGNRKEVEPGRFERELRELDALRGFGHVIVEATLGDIRTPPPESGANPKSIIGQILSLMMDYPMVHWHFLDSRRDAELFAFTLMEMFWRRHESQSRRSH